MGKTSLGGVNTMNNGKRNERKMVTILVSMGLCVIALGGGLTYYALEKAPTQKTEETQKQSVQTDMVSPATAPKTPSLETAQLERDKMSQDDGEEPDKNAEQKQPPQKATPKAPEPKPEKQTTQKTELTFAYPISGEIVMPYSVDKAVYDPTLEQYRTNDNICIAAQEGTAVSAAADGKVLEVKDDAESGKTVVVEHADGWRTTYSPLSQQELPKAGDTVTKGQIIGKLDKPTKYQVGLGSHLEFSLERDGQKINPQEKLEQQS